MDGSLSKLFSQNCLSKPKVHFGRQIVIISKLRVFHQVTAVVLELATRKLCMCIDVWLCY